MAEEEEKQDKPEGRPELEEKWPGYSFMVYQSNIIGSTRDVYGRPIFQSEEIDDEGEDFWADVIVRKLTKRAHEARLVKNGKGRVIGIIESFKQSDLPHGASRAERRQQKRLDQAEAKRVLRNSSSKYGRGLQSKSDKGKTNEDHN